VRSTTVHALVLAAGAARRFGSPKGLADYRGRPLIRHVVESVSTAIATRGPASAVTVVLGPEPEPLREALSGTGVDIAINEHWSDGLSSSLRLGIQSLPPGSTAVLIVLADQALVASDEYQRLLDVARTNPERPIAAAYDDTVGVPAVFPARYFERLSALQGDRGAGSLLKSDDQVVPIDMPSAAFDIDTPELRAAALKDPETPVALKV